ncbi:unnamed protein product [Sphagnum balticum]
MSGRTSPPSVSSRHRTTSDCASVRRRPVSVVRHMRTTTLTVTMVAATSAPNTKHTRGGGISQHWRILGRTGDVFAQRRSAAAEAGADRVGGALCQHGVVYSLMCAHSGQPASPCKYTMLCLLLIAALVDGAPVDQHFADTRTSVCDEQRHKCEQKIALDVENDFSNMNVSRGDSKYVREQLDECDDAQ